MSGVHHTTTCDHWYFPLRAIAYSGVITVQVLWEICCSLIHESIYLTDAAAVPDRRGVTFTRPLIRFAIMNGTPRNAADVRQRLQRIALELRNLASQVDAMQRNGWHIRMYGDRDTRRRQLASERAAASDWEEKKCEQEDLISKYGIPTPLGFQQQRRRRQSIGEGGGWGNVAARIIERGLSQSPGRNRYPRRESRGRSPSRERGRSRSILQSSPPPLPRPRSAPWSPYARRASVRSFSRSPPPRSRSRPSSRRDRSRPLTPMSPRIRPGFSRSPSPGCRVMH